MWLAGKGWSGRAWWRRSLSCSRGRMDDIRERTCFHSSARKVEQIAVTSRHSAGMTSARSPGFHSPRSEARSIPGFYSTAGSRGSLGPSSSCVLGTAFVFRPLFRLSTYVSTLSTHVSTPVVSQTSHSFRRTSSSSTQVFTNVSPSYRFLSLSLRGLRGRLSLLPPSLPFPLPRSTSSHRRLPARAPPAVQACRSFHARLHHRLLACATSAASLPRPGPVPHLFH